MCNLVVPLQNFAIFVYPTLPESSIRYTKGRWFLLSGVYDRESNISHMGVGGGGVNV